MCPILVVCLRSLSEIDQHANKACALPPQTWKSCAGALRAGQSSDTEDMGTWVKMEASLWAFQSCGSYWAQNCRSYWSLEMKQCSSGQTWDLKTGKPTGQQQHSVYHVPMTRPGCCCACTLPCCPATGLGLSGDEDGDSAFLEVTQTLSSHLGWVQHTRGPQHPLALSTRDKDAQGGWTFLYPA